MDRARSSKKLAKMSVRPGDDIPQALRDVTRVRKSPKLYKPMLILAGLVGMGGITFLTRSWLFPASEPTQIAASSSSNPLPVETTSIEFSQTKSNESANSILGHLSYEQAPESELRPISKDGRIRLREEAAAKFLQMQAAAKKAGVNIVTISGFRSVAQQQHIFFDVKEQRGQIASKRAEVSAPPGYSEHHTGYAVDVGDGNVPATNLNPSFENTAAFKWLAKNAAYYSFELSFPRNNLQGVSYEPWHWRFVGDLDSLETFYRARNLK